MFSAEDGDSPPQTPLAPTNGLASSPRNLGVTDTPQKGGRFSAAKMAAAPSPSTTGSYIAHNGPIHQSRPSRLNLEHSDTMRIGEGSFGEVYRAVYDLDKQQYAIKVSSKPIAGEMDLQHRLQEAYAASVCSNQYLLRYYDCWLDDKRLHLRLEFVEGGTIQKLPKPWSEEDLAWLLLQLGMALQWLHNSGIAHLDIKPDNILMTKNQDIGRWIFKLGDLGLARKVRPPSDALIAANLDGSVDDDAVFQGENDDEGDHRYLCPKILESYSTSTSWNKEADMFSLGASLVELMGGIPGRARFQEYGPHFTDRSKYSVRLASLVQRLCDLTPANRPCALEVMEEALTILRTYNESFARDLDYRLDPRRRMFEALQAKERTLKREIAVAEATGSTAGFSL